LPSPVNVGTDRLANFGTDGGESLGKFSRGDAIAGQPLVIQPLELLELTRLQALKVAVNSLDRKSLPNATAAILDRAQFCWKGDRKLLAVFIRISM
jgi:hypothetical protein